MLLEDLLKEYRYDMKVRNYSERTIKTCYNSSLKFFTYCKREFGIEDIEDMMPIYLKQYISYLQSIGRSEVYINSIIKYLRGFFKYSVKEEDVTEIVKRVKALIINSNNEILLAYSNNCYQFPGGHVEDGETLIDAVNREIKEETGIVLNNYVQQCRKMT